MSKFSFRSPCAGIPLEEYNHQERRLKIAAILLAGGSIDADDDPENELVLNEDKCIKDAVRQADKLIAEIERTAGLDNKAAEK